MNPKIHQQKPSRNLLNRENRFTLDGIFIAVDKTLIMPLLGLHYPSPIKLLSLWKVDFITLLSFNEYLKLMFLLLAKSSLAHDVNQLIIEASLLKKRLQQRINYLLYFRCLIKGHDCHFKADLCGWWKVIISRWLPHLCTTSVFVDTPSNSL